MELTVALLNKYFTGKQTRASFEDAKKQYDILRAHTNGEFPGRLIQERRPSETQEIFDYRKKIYQPITVEPMSAIIRSLGKIRRSSDYSIKYEEKSPPNIAKGETLKDYCEIKFPYFKSVTNWAFNILLKNLLIDTNAVILVAPLEQEVEPNEYLRPFPVIYNSDRVYEYIPEELAILLSTETTSKKGKIFIAVNEKVIQKWEQVDTTVKYNMTSEYEHGLEKMPVFRLPGIFMQMYGTNDMLTASHLQPMVPRLNEAVREYSDMQAEVVQNIFSERWEVASQKCEECMVDGVSTGKIKSSGKGAKIITCTKCNGTGNIGSSPYKKMVISLKGALGSQPVPMPPGGFLEKKTDIVILQDKRVDAHIYKSLVAVNMQFLSQVPLSISGDAKAYDKEETNNFAYGIAEDLIAVEDEIYYFINEYRNRGVIESSEARQKQLPIIPVPQNFDLMNSAGMLEELKGVRSSQAAPIIILNHEINYCVKTFYNQPEVKNELVAVMMLDPLPATNDDEKSLRLNMGGITKKDYVISCNISQFVKRAAFENTKFYQMELDEQKDIVSGYADELITGIKADEAGEMKVAAAAQAAAAKANPPKFGGDA